MGINELHSLNDLIAKNTVQTSDFFSSNELMMKAASDFKYICASCNLNTRSNGKLVEVSKINKIGDYLCVGVERRDGKVKFPTGYLDGGVENNNLAVVVYEAGAVLDILVFPSKEVCGKHGLFSIFGEDKKSNMTTVKISNLDKLEKYKFGVVFSEYTK